SHTFETPLGDIDATASAPSFGLLVRAEFISVIAVDFWVNYAFGTLETEAGGFSTDVDADGIHLGVDAFYRIQIGSFKTWIEVGPYFTYGSSQSDDAGDDNATVYLSYGAMV